MIRQGKGSNKIKSFLRKVVLYQGLVGENWQYGQVNNGTEPITGDLSKLLQQGLSGRGFGGTSGGRGTSLGSICRTIFNEAHHLKKELAKLGHEFVDPMLALNSLEGVKSELTPNELQAHHASYSKVCTELQNINDRFTYLRGAYQGYLGVMHIGGCRNSYNRVDLPSEPTPLDAFIGPMELLDYKKKYGNEVIIPEEQEGDDSDLGASGWQRLRRRMLAQPIIKKQTILPTENDPNKSTIQNKVVKAPMLYSSDGIPVARKLFDIVMLLKAEEQPLTNNDMIRKLAMDVVNDSELFESACNNERIFYDRAKGTFEYKPTYKIRSKEDLLELLKRIVVSRAWR
ncbi:hypothetical protein BASA61_001478 [Batrachochytrium salamandrivorans]|nr:hypothetical protein BASA61_001478 [Batrachochytrium salamandrivorans]